MSVTRDSQNYVERSGAYRNGRDVRDESPETPTLSTRSLEIQDGVALDNSLIRVWNVVDAVRRAARSPVLPAGIAILHPSPANT